MAVIGDENASCAPALLESTGECAMKRHSTYAVSREERLQEEAKRLRAEAEELPIGRARDALLQRARQAETTR